MKGLYARLAEWGAAFTGIGTFEGPFGNRFRLVAADEVLAPLPDASTEDLPPGGASEGLGIVAVRFDAPRGTSGAICEFYSSVFGATAEAGAGRCVVSVGAAQTLEFVEADEVAAYDGHHIASCAVRKSTTSRRWRGGLNADFHAGCTSTAPRSCAATEL